MILSSFPLPPSKKLHYEEIIIPLSLWSNNVQTVEVPGVHAEESEQLVLFVPKVSSQREYYDAGILCTVQAEGSLTFTCQTTPTIDLTVYVVFLEVSK